MSDCSHAVIAMGTVVPMSKVEGSLICSGYCNGNSVVRMARETRNSGAHVQGGRQLDLTSR